MVTTPPPTRPGTVARDFYALRRDGIAGIERAGHRQWTDYNSHDPGITILEAFAYAVTDLAYRTDFDVADLLGPQRGPDPYPGQVFFGPPDILTVNPTTAPDLRRLLVDLPGVRNAWLRTDCRCGPSPDRSPGAGCAPAGLYEVTLELEAEPTVGDLNDRVTRRRRWLTDADGRRRGVTVEVWFPRWRLADGELRHRLIGQPGPVQVAVAGPFRTTTGSTPVGDEELRTHWHEVFFVDLDLDLADGSTLRLPRAALRLYGDAAARRLTDGQTVRGWLADPGDIGFVEAYRRKLALADAAVGQAVTALHAHRNLAEDACRVTLVEVTPVAVCANVEVQPGADLAEVQARLWFEVEEYLDPAPVFASPAGLLADGIPVEDVFNGPALTHGVLTDQTLTDTDRRVDLRVSDLLNRLMDVPGVAGVEHLQLTGYDDAGRPVAGLADPDWSAGPAVFDPARVSAQWRLVLPPGHRPRLHRELSRLLFSAGGLPFLPRADEVEDLAADLRVTAIPRVFSAEELQLPFPTGRARDLTGYAYLQDCLPRVYGVGPDGLPSTADAARRVQAEQLQGYLMVFEQLLRNAQAQLAGAGDLFSLDPAVTHTYFAELLPAPRRIGDTPVLTGLTEQDLAGLVESPPAFAARRNRFLDHLLARFGESFAEHPLLVGDPAGRAHARTALIADKLAFLRGLPGLGRDRGRAFDRTGPATPGNVSGLQGRVARLLGVPEWAGQERAVVVEHLLLRPKFPGDATWRPDGCACDCGGDDGCGDPYSFRISCVFPGWTEPFGTEPAMRAFADRTVAEQAPAHLLVKVCWVGRELFEEFEQAWAAWAQADVAVDWTAQRLPETVAELLGEHAPALDRAAACTCAEQLLGQVGRAFRTWLDAGVAAGVPVGDLPAFTAPELTGCPEVELPADVLDRVRAVLTARYGGYAEVSHRLGVLLDVLARLRNSHPPATLHDCDEGSDANPVRLGRTVLGGN